MQRPTRLLFKNRIEHGLKLVLHPCCLKDTYRLVRAFMEHGIAYDDPHLRRKLGAYFLNHRMKSPAGFAGRIEEFDKRYRSLIGTEAR